jgi:hypothetical protein
MFLRNVVRRSVAYEFRKAHRVEWLAGPIKELVRCVSVPNGTEESHVKSCDERHMKRDSTLSVPNTNPFVPCVVLTMEPVT